MTDDELTFLSIQLKGLIDNNQKLTAALLENKQEALAFLQAAASNRNLGFPQCLPPNEMVNAFNSCYDNAFQNLSKQEEVAATILSFIEKRR